MKLTINIYLNKVFHLAKSWDVSHRVYKDVNKKTLNFLAQFRPLLNNLKNCSISDASSCLSKLITNVGCFWGVLAKTPPKSSVKRQFLLVRKHLKI